MTIKSVLQNAGITVNDRRSIAMGGGTKRAKSRVTHIARHHSGVNVDQSMSILEGYWKNTHGWNTGGYHVVIHFDGSVDWNYDYDVTSNGVGNHNSYIFNISVLGNGKFTAAQEKSFAIVAKEVQRELGIPTKNVWGHNDFSGHKTNSCPGIDMNTVRKALDDNKFVVTPVVNPVKTPVKAPAKTPTKTPAKATGNAIIKGIQETVGVTKDGWDGPNTRKGVVKLFQRFFGANDDGFVGNETLNKSKPIRKNDRGLHVYALQAMLYLKGFTVVGKPDQVAGKNTVQGIKDFQKANGLGVDGIAGSKTYAKLLKL